LESNQGIRKLNLGYGLEGNLLIYQCMVLLIFKTQVKKLF